MVLMTTGKNVRPPPPPPPAFVTRYDVVPPAAKSWLAFNSSQRIQGQFIDTGSNLIGRVFTRLTFWVNRWSRGSGNLVATIRDANNAVKSNFGSKAVSSLALNDDEQAVTFTNLNNKYAIQAKDFIAIEHSNPNGELDGCRSPKSVSNTSWVKWNNGSSPGTWGQSTTRDMCGTFETGGV
jgi:hypothetical protein